MVKGFSKMYTFFIFGQIFFRKHFYYITGFCDKKFHFCKFANFFADSKSRAQELSNDVSFVIVGHKTWDFKYPRAGIGLKGVFAKTLPLSAPRTNQSERNLSKTVKFKHTVSLYIIETKF